MTRYDIALKRFPRRQTPLELLAEAARNRVPLTGWQVFDLNKKREAREEAWDFRARLKYHDEVKLVPEPEWKRMFRC